MIELSLGKMVLLALIALIVLGPEKLPGAARTAGALLRRVRSGWDNVRAEVERELEVEEIKRAARAAAAHAEAVQTGFKATAQQLHEPFEQAALMVRGQSPAADTQPAPIETSPTLEHVAGEQAELPLDGMPAAAPDQDASRGHA